MNQIKYAIFDVGKTVYPFSLTPLVAYMQKNTSKPDIFNAHHSPIFYDYKPYMKGEMTTTEFAEELCFFCCVPYNEEHLKNINFALHQGCGKRFPETLKAMDILKKHNIEICLLSNALPLLADTGNDLVKPQYAFTSYDLKCLKPDREIFQTVLEKLNTSPKQVLFIDDKKANIESAQALGINGIIYEQTTILKKLNFYLPPSPNFHHLREV